MKPLHALTSRLRFEALEDRAVPATLFVDDDRMQIPSAKYTTIQAAVNAAGKNDTIIVANGTYAEQVTVPSNKDGLTIRAQNTGKATIRVPATTAGDSLVLIAGADDVTLRGFTITRSDTPGASLGSIVYAVAVEGGSADIFDNTIKDFRNDPQNGAQVGVGIVVYGVDLRTSADIRNNTLFGYQKAGIVVQGERASATVEKNSLDGGGPTDVIAKNGVQVSDGATAHVEDNLIVGHRYTVDTFVSAGISIDDTCGVEVEGNRLSGNDVAIYVSNSRGTEIEKNWVKGNVEGIQVYDSRDVEITCNTILDTGNTPRDGEQIGIGIYVDGLTTTTVEIEGNTIARYQKAGIVIVGDKASADIECNTVDGGGPTGVIARNGIQVSEGATANIEDNKISGNLYTGTDFVAVGISIDDTSGVHVEGNLLTGNGVAVYASKSTKLRIECNTVFGNVEGLFVLNSTKVSVIGNRVWLNQVDGIGLVNVTGGTVEDNRVSLNGQDGIYLEGSKGIAVKDNRVTLNGRDGLVISLGSTGNTISGNELYCNDRYDAYDDSVGSGTGGTGNTWRRNHIGTQNRPGLR